MTSEKRPPADESMVRYRTLRESLNMDEVRPWVAKKDNDETLVQIGRLVRKTMDVEMELAKRMVELFSSEDVAMEDFARLMAERGISAVSLWFCARLLKGKKIDGLMDQLVRERQRSASIARYSKDPKQRAKAEVKKLWEMWRLDLSRYPSKAAFARDMLDKFDELKSSKKIEDWARAWEKEIT